MKNRSEAIYKKKEPRFWVVTGDTGECLLCGLTPCVVCLFRPEYPAEFKLRKGQAIAYLLCDPCWEKNRLDYVEAAIRAEIPE